MKFFGYFHCFIVLKNGNLIVCSFLPYLLAVNYFMRKNFPHQVLDYSDIKFVWEMEDKFGLSPLTSQFSELLKCAFTASSGDQKNFLSNINIKFDAFAT